MKTQRYLANELYDTVVRASQMRDVFGLSAVISAAIELHDHPDVSAAMRETADLAIHDYALMLAARINPAFDADAHLKHPAPHDDIVSALEESGLLMNNE